MDGIPSRIADFFSAVSPAWLTLWCGLVVLTSILFLMMWTPWGKAKPLRKCVLLSLVAHTLMGIYATTVQIAVDSRSDAPEQVAVSLVDVDEDAPGAPTRPPKPWEETPLTAPPEADAEPAPPLPNPFAAPAVEPSEPIPAAETPLPTPSGVDEQLPQPDALAWEGDEQELEAAAAAELEAPPGPQMQSAPAPPIDTPLRPEPELDLFQGDGRERERPSDPGEESPLAAPVGELFDSSLVEATPEAEVSVGPARLDSLDASLEAAPAAVPEAATTVNPEAPPGLTPEAPPLADELRPDPAVRRSTAGPLAPLSAESPAQVAARPDGVYANRDRASRAESVDRFGGAADTEAAVAAALAWLAVVQGPDGRWDAEQFGAGGRNPLAQHQTAGVGRGADVGVSALAMLAFLGAGNTHQNGEYSQVVSRGLTYLLRSQRPGGEIAAGADDFSRMYCHGMATFGLAEVYALTLDPKLRRPLESAVAYSVAAQHPTEGGWRYHPGDRGDVSQFGWQVMALRSAQRTGIEIPGGAKLGMLRFLERASQGRYGGLAGYRPGDRPSRPMTAEALVCRQFLDVVHGEAMASEAASFVLQETPGVGMANHYYWYYATLAMHQLQGDAWQRWNAALKQELLGAQQRGGEFAGSWAPDGVWGRQGGRVFSTALCAMCLESYYRYAPLASLRKELR